MVRCWLLQSPARQGVPFFMNRLCFCVALTLLSLPALAQPLVVEDAWVRAMPPTQRMTAAYMRLTNAGNEAVEVRGVTALGAGEASIHATRREGDQVRMEALDSLTVAGGETVQLQPAGLHIMLMGLERMPAVGETLELCLETNAGRQCLNAEVRRDAPGGHDHH